MMKFNEFIKGICQRFHYSTFCHGPLVTEQTEHQNGNKKAHRFWDQGRTWAGQIFLPANNANPLTICMYSEQTRITV